MQSNSEQNPNERPGISFFDTIVEIYQWLEIVVAVLIAGMIIAILVYDSKPGNTSRSWVIVIMIIALVVGVILATSALRKKRKVQDNSENNGI
jgi:general stress protein CsbA